MAEGDRCAPNRHQYTHWPNVELISTWPMCIQASAWATWPTRSLPSIGKGSVRTQLTGCSCAPMPELGCAVVGGIAKTQMLFLGTNGAVSFHEWALMHLQLPFPINTKRYVSTAATFGKLNGEAGK